MNTALKWKLALGFVLAFLAGSATGGFFVANQAHHRRMDFAQHRHSLAERMRSRMQAELNLTPEQIAKTAPIFDRSVNELEKIRAETGERVHEVIAETNRALAPELTDAQRAKLDELQKQSSLRHGPRRTPRHRAQEPPN
jgi:Spy/CpxP family protein refolding chaperone